MASAAAASTPPSVQDDGALSHKQIVTILIGLMMGMFLAALDQTIVASAMRVIADDLNGPGRAGVGDHRLPDHLDDRHPALRQAVRHLRAQEVVHHRHHDLHRSARCCARSRPRSRCWPRSAPSRASAPAACSRWRSRSSATSCRRGSGPSTRATSSPSSAPRASSARSSAASSPARTTLLGIAGWRWVFLVNVPIGIAALVVVSRTLHLRHTRLRPPDRLVGRRRAHHRPGAAAASSPSRAASWGWDSSRSIACYAIGVVGRRRLRPDRAADGRRGPDADASSSRTAPSASPRSPRSSSAWACSAASPALPLYLQIVKGASPTAGRPAAAADDPRHHDRLDRLRPDDLAHRPLPALPDHRLGPAGRSRCSGSTTSAPTPRCGRR